MVQLENKIRELEKRVVDSETARESNFVELIRNELEEYHSREHLGESQSYGGLRFLERPLLPLGIGMLMSSNN